jgi:hypothetical protein
MMKSRGRGPLLATMLIASLIGQNATSLAAAAEAGCDQTNK